jgi:hypothetical protein
MASPTRRGIVRSGHEHNDDDDVEEVGAGHVDVEEEEPLGKAVGGGVWRQMNQHIAVVVLTELVCIGALQFGFHIGFSSPAGRMIRDEAQLTSQQLDMVLSVLNVGCMVGGLISGAIANRFGRKWSIVLMSVPFILGSLTMIQTPPDYATLLAGRICKLPFVRWMAFVQYCCS